ncbi:MAG: hypothetical protein JSV78_14725 [Phycisphaerales bacterium]|nr:MAG: hypothetical protein JSV78_14725 [Phycisphaerales bacterium]
MSHSNPSQKGPGPECKSTHTREKVNTGNIPTSEIVISGGVTRKDRARPQLRPRRLRLGEAAVRKKRHLEHKPLGGGLRTPVACPSLPATTAPALTDQCQSEPSGFIDADRYFEVSQATADQKGPVSDSTGSFSHA